MTELSDRPISTARLRHVLLAVKEIIGSNGLIAILKQAELERYIAELPPASQALNARSGELATLIQAIERMYGKGARGQLRRIGAATFEHVVQSDRLSWRLLRLRLRFVPRSMERQRLALTRLAAYLGASDGKVQVYKEEGQLFLIDTVADEYVGRENVYGDNYFMLGLIHAVVHWATGRDYEVIQVNNRANGDPDSRFRIGEAYT